jgi:hypothetical protein
MAILKMTFLVNFQDRAGWSETHYRTLSGIPDLGDGNIARIVRATATRRAGCLSGRCSIRACRVSYTDTPASVRLVQINQPGALINNALTTNGGPDVPNVSLLTTLVGTNGTRRAYFLRGLADGDVVDAQVTFARFGQGPYTAWFNELAAGQYNIRDQVNGVATGVVSIAGSTGIMTTVGPTGYPADQVVLVKTRNAGNGKRITWTGRAFSNDGVSVQLRNWRYGNAEGGTIRALTTVFRQITDAVQNEPRWARTRKTGRPGDLSRGRVSNRS